MSLQSSASATEAVRAYPGEPGAAVKWPTRRPRAGGWARLPIVLRRLILVGGLIGLWQAWIEIKHISPFVFPKPWVAAKAFWHGWSTGNFVDPTWTTLRILGIGMGIGVGLALVFVVLATWTKVGDDLLSLLSAMLNPLPSVAILPAAMLIFGLNTTALLFVIANATIWPIAINVAMGFKTVNPAIVAVGRNIGLSPVRLVLEVLSPAALPYAVTGIKTAWAFGWRTMIAAELVFGAAGSKGGLGFEINNSRLYTEPDRMVALIITIMLIGIAFDFLFTLLERRTVVRWGMKTNT
jgi:NitT/TauT family transport system permease protein